jgi:hypothetical protein
MPQKPETKFRAKFDKKLKLVPKSWFESIQQKAIQGTPDKLGCVNGYFVGLELKATPQGQPTKLQELKLSGIVAAGGVACVVHPGNADEVISLLIRLAAIPKPPIVYKEKV